MERIEGYLLQAIAWFIKTALLPFLLKPVPIKVQTTTLEEIERIVEGGGYES